MLQTANVHHSKFREKNGLQYHNMKHGLKCQNLGVSKIIHDTSHAGDKRSSHCISNYIVSVYNDTHQCIAYYKGGSDSKAFSSNKLIE